MTIPDRKFPPEEEDKILVLKIVFVCPVTNEVATVEDDDFFFPQDEYCDVFVTKCSSCGGVHEST